MKIYLGFRFTGENIDTLEDFLGEIQDRLERLGHEVYCSLWDDHFFMIRQYSRQQIFDYLYKRVASSDTVLFIVKSSERSEGMGIEADWVQELGKKSCLVIKEGTQYSALERIADKKIEYSDLKDLTFKLVDFCDPEHLPGRKK